MENRSLKELYQLLLDNFDEIDGGGICCKIGYFKKFSSEEGNIIYKDFLNRRPNIFSKFWWHWKYNQFGNKYGYWWDLTEASNKQRKLFIQSIINKL